MLSVWNKHPDDEARSPIVRMGPENRKRIPVLSPNQSLDLVLRYPHRPHCIAPSSQYQNALSEPSLIVANGAPKMPRHMSTSSDRDLDLAARLARLALAVGLAYLLFLTFSPFFMAIAWAAVLSYTLFPLHRRLMGAIGGRKTLSALFMCIAVGMVVVLPLLYLAAVAGSELAKAYESIAALLAQDGSFDERWRNTPMLGVVREYLREYERLTGTDLRTIWADSLKDLAQWILEEVSLIARNLLVGLFQIALTVICLFYFLRDGDRVASWVEATLPLPPHQQRIIFERFDEVVTASVEGSTIVAILEGLVGGIAFWLTGLPTPVLWGVVMGLLAYVPAVGASLVWVPAAVYWWMAGLYTKTAIVCLAGLVIVLIDQAGRTMLVGTRSKLHPMLLFLSVVGGIKVFGILGFVAGPLAVALGRTMLDIYRLEKTGTIEPPSVPLTG